MSHRCLEIKNTKKNFRRRWFELVVKFFICGEQVKRKKISRGAVQVPAPGSSTTATTGIRTSWRLFNVDRCQAGRFPGLPWKDGWRRPGLCSQRRPVRRRRRGRGLRRLRGVERRRFQSRWCPGSLKPFHPCHAMQLSFHRIRYFGPIQSHECTWGIREYLRDNLNGEYKHNFVEILFQNWIFLGPCLLEVPRYWGANDDISFFPLPFLAAFLLSDRSCLSFPHRLAFMNRAW